MKFPSTIHELTSAFTIQQPVIEYLKCVIVFIRTRSVLYGSSKLTSNTKIKFEQLIYVNIGHVLEPTLPLCICLDRML